MTPETERLGLRIVLYLVAAGATLLWAASLFSATVTAYERVAVFGFAVVAVVGLACSVPGRR
jgi:hypothetical protein